MSTVGKSLQILLEANFRKYKKCLPCTKIDIKDFAGRFKQSFSAHCFYKDMLEIGLLNPIKSIFEGVYITTRDCVCNTTLKESLYYIEQENLSEWFSP